jgi:hypothetical protein
MSLRLIDEHEKKLVGGLTGLFHTSLKICFFITYLWTWMNEALPRKSPAGNRSNFYQIPLKKEKKISYQTSGNAISV